MKLDLSYIASNETGPNSVPNPAATYGPPDTFKSSLLASFASLAKLYPALPNTYSASFPLLVVIKLNLPKAYTGTLLAIFVFSFLSFNFPELAENLYSEPTPHSNSPWLSTMYSKPATGPGFNLKSEPLTSEPDLYFL